MLYLPDSNALITSLRGGGLESLRMGLEARYPSEVRNQAEARQWLERWFERGFRNGCLVGTEELFEEVGRKHDPASLLLRRLKSCGLIRILPPKPETFEHLALIEQFVRRRFDAHQADDFLKSSDPMFIALAKTHGATLITLESHGVPQYDRARGRIGGRPRMPYVAWVFDVRCISLYQALQEITC